MKEYIKPTFIKAGLFPVALAVNCTTSRDEAMDVCDIFGITDVSTAFGATEKCEVQYDVGDYCKFTSVENNFIQIFTS